MTKPSPPRTPKLTALSVFAGILILAVTMSQGALLSAPMVALSLAINTAAIVAGVWVIFSPRVNGVRR